LLVTWCPTTGACNNIISTFITNKIGSIFIIYTMVMQIAAANRWHAFCKLVP
jgi:hypothetical protein